MIFSYALGDKICAEGTGCNLQVYNKDLQQTDCYSISKVSCLEHSDVNLRLMLKLFKFSGNL